MNKKRTSARCLKAFTAGLIFFAAFEISYAQENLTLINPYTPTLSDAFKLQENPKMPDSTVEKLTLNYKLSPELYSTTFPVDPIKPAKMSGEPLDKLYRSYVKIGFGNKWTPFVEFNYSNLRSTDQAIGFYLNHLSSSGKIKNFAFPGFSDNDLGLYTKKFYKYHTLAADVDYQRNVVHYYGFNPDDDDFSFIPDINNKDSIKQRLMTIGGQVKFYSTFNDSTRFNHFLSLKYKNASDRYDAMEDNLAFRSYVNKNAKIFGRSFDHQNFGLNLNIDLYNDRNRSDTSTDAVISVLPHFSATYNILKFYVGLNTSFAAGDSSDIFIYPDATLDINLFNNVFILFAQFDGELVRNNLISFFSENPFINTSLPLEYSNIKSRMKIGVKGSLSSYVSYNAYFSKSKVENLPLFVNDTTLTLFNKFTAIYDNASILNTHTEITYQKSEKIKLMLISNYYEYKMSTEKRAWHKPSMDVRLALNYNLKNKIILKTEVFAFSSSDAKTYNFIGTPEVKIERLKGTVDFNLGLEYRYTKILSGFINLNNIGAVRYQKWYNYPGYGFTALAGITYAF